METKVLSKSDLAELLRVSDSDTGREQIEYIDIEQIAPDPRNFYELSGIEELTANIELLGLQQPLRVRDDPMDPDRVIIVSGHRRRAALEKLVSEGREDLRAVPCIREKEAGSEALQELRLIYANSDIRKMTPAEISHQAERVEGLLYRLRMEGYSFPGRMRDHVSEACKVSRSKLARLKVIRDGLIPEWMELFESSTLSESTAYELARMEQEEQQRFFPTVRDPKYLYAIEVQTIRNTIERIKATDAREKCGLDTCRHIDARIDHSISVNIRSLCHNCCRECPYLTTCETPCAHADDEKARREEENEQRMREISDAREKQKQAYEKEAAAEDETAKRRWRRVIDAWQTSDVALDDVVMQLSRGNMSGEISEIVSGQKEPNRYCPEPLPVDEYDLAALIGVADLLGCSLDYLVGRTDVREMAK